MEVAEIKVESHSDGSQFTVTVVEGSSQSQHRVTVSDQDYQNYSPGGALSRPELVKKSFEFLLQRESKESIMSAFELNVIERYFPEFPKVITK